MTRKARLVIGSVLLIVFIVLARWGFATAFFRGMDSAISGLAIEFANALVNGDYEQAHAMLSPEAQGRISARDLENEYLAMVNIFGTGKSARVVFDPQFTMRNWPGKLPGDRGWVYVSIAGDDFVEAVSVIVTEIQGEYRIREIEWGRP